LKLTAPYDDDDARTIPKGSLSLYETGQATVRVEILGEVDEANGALADHPVGDLVMLGGLAPTWTTSDASVVEVEPDGQDDYWVIAKGAGEADIRASAGDVSKVVHVTVLPAGGYR
jgi:hypothetical protein